MSKKLTLSLKLLFGAFLLLILPHCGKYKPQQLHRPHGQVKEEEDIEVTKYVFNEDDCLKYFDRRIIKRGYQPIQLCIRNKTGQTLELDAQDISMPLVATKTVAKAIHREVSTNAIKYFVICCFMPIAAIFSGLKDIEINKKIDDDFEEKTFGENQMISIKPNRTFNKVIFVTRENYNAMFEITLTKTVSNEKVTFDL